ncbi:MAG: cobalamin biosynthesis protein CobD, partial [Lachnospiraceae bacterium]|nr:cobalamin biosynthesis protein CobD [Lachnospiraceae bacterium]
MWNEIIKTFPLVAAASFILDAFIGDPRWLPHPVRLMGRVISRFDGKFNNESYNNSARFFAGALFSLCFTIFTGVISGALLFVLFTVDFRLGILGEIIMSTYCLAAHDLIKHAMNVYNCRYNLDEARIAVGMIVGRETGKLSDQGVIKATVESIAESTCDGVIAPAFYILLFGPVGGMVYKAVNTMDSMIGYHNEKYEYYGKPAAIADDILNFIPSRISAMCIITASAMIRGMDHMGAFRIWRRDRYNHKSPNS